ncbi:MAG: hypothetical protein AB1806_15345 [Acidobacteriota bacterium]
MGCCINYFIGFENLDALDRALAAVVEHAATLGFDVRRRSFTEQRRTVTIQPHEHCETLVFDFMTVEHWAQSGEEPFCGREIMQTNWDDCTTWTCTFLRPHLWYCAGFVKTEYAPKSVHAKVCELLRGMAPRAALFCVRDEAGFYETRSRDALEEGHGYLAGRRVDDLPRREA